MIYSKTCEYAIRSLSFFALYPEKESATVKEVSRGTGVPHAYVAKIFQCLAHSRILTSQRGPAGGYTLLVAPAKLSLLKIVQSLDDLQRSPFSLCIMGLHACDDKNPCPLHDIWAKAKEKMLKTLSSTTVADVAHLTGEYRHGKHRRFVLSKKMREIFTYGD